MSIPPLIARFLIHSIFYQIIRTLFVHVKNKIVEIIFFIPRAAWWMIEEYKMSLEQKLGMSIRIVKLPGHPVRTGQARRGFPAR